VDRERRKIWVQEKILILSGCGPAATAPVAGRPKLPSLGVDGSTAVCTPCGAEFNCFFQ